MKLAHYSLLVALALGATCQAQELNEIIKHSGDASGSNTPREETTVQVGKEDLGASSSTGSVAWIRTGSSSFRSDAKNPWKMRYLFSLLLVGGLMIGGFIGLRRLQARLPGLGRGGADVRVVGRVPLDQRNTLFVIQLRGEELVLTSGSARTNLLSRRPIGAQEEGG